MHALRTQWGSRSRGRVRAGASVRRHRRATAHPPTALPGSTCSWLEKDPSRASSPAGACTRACGARQATGSMPAACLSLTPKNDCCPQGGGRGAGGANGAAEKASPDTNSPVDCLCLASSWALAPGAACKARAEVGARTRALRDLTHRECSSATNAVSAASFAVRPQTEHRREPSRSEGERRLSPDCAPPAALLAHRPRPSAFADVRERTHGAEPRLK